eukprot:GEZU01036828.1.p1 GENE.GEZU01036828.1~~GEZU01036828.1.p1  ORF type:complete len:149 (-),score=21.58 GEZU01036828.1:32-478(-)
MNTKRTSTRPPFSWSPPLSFPSRSTCETEFFSKDLDKRQQSPSAAAGEELSQQTQEVLALSDAYSPHQDNIVSSSSYEFEQKKSIQARSRVLVASSNSRNNITPDTPVTIISSMIMQPSFPPENFYRVAVETYATKRSLLQEKASSTS